MKRIEKEEINKTAKLLDDAIWLAREKGEAFDLSILYSGTYFMNNIIRESIKLKRDKFDSRDLFKYMSIAREFLVNSNHIIYNSKNLNKDILGDVYEGFKDKIIGNTDLGRLVLHGASNVGPSFLQMLLWNRNIKFTDLQKKRIINEAMNMPGTKKSNDEEDLRKASIKEKIMKDNNIPEDRKDFAIATNIYYGGIFKSLSTQYAHGSFPFDIRYYILTHPEFEDMKDKLIYDFYGDEDIYAQFINDINWDIINTAHIEKESGTEHLFDAWDMNDFSVHRVEELMMHEGATKEELLRGKEAIETISALESFNDLRSFSYNSKIYKI